MDIGMLIGILAGLIFGLFVIGEFIKAKRKFRRRQSERKPAGADREMFDQMDEDVKKAG